jgi:large subunit ribosomal protein L18
MNRLELKSKNQAQRAKRTRTRIVGTTERPRLSVNVSNMHVSAQIIDDSTGKTLAYASTVGKKTTGNKTDKAADVGKDIAVKAKKAKVSKVSFDRGAKQYHGRIKALADNAREGGLEF